MMKLIRKSFQFYTFISVLIISGYFKGSNSLNINDKQEEDWICDDQTHIPTSFLCDGEIDCDDGSDEFQVYCGKKCELQCRDGSGCYKSYQECDTIPNCFDNSDESNCEMVFGGPEESFFNCSGGNETSQFGYNCKNDLDCLEKDSGPCYPRDNDILATSLPSTVGTTKPAETTPTSSTIATTTSTITTTTSTTTTPTIATTTLSARTTASSKVKTLSIPSTPSRKCLRNPNKRVCSQYLEVLAKKHLSAKFIKRCQKIKKINKKKLKAKCKKYKKVLKIRKKLYPLEFVPSKCQVKPRRRRCKKYHQILAAVLPLDEIKQTCSKKPRSKKCKNFKVLLEVTHSS